MQNTDTRNEGAVSHPSAEDWMEFLYREMPAQRRRELGDHLSHCPTCSRQLKSWRLGMSALDEWELPVFRRAPSRWQPALKWATAAAAVLAVGFLLGRQTSNTAGELAALKASVARISETVERDREAIAVNATDEATAAAQTEVVRLIGDYAQTAEEIRSEDRRTTALALRQLESRLGRLRAELETVAVNTEDSFQQTQEGLASLVSLTISEGTKPESHQ